MPIEISDFGEVLRFNCAIPTPVSPTFYIYDYWTVTGASVKSWDYTIPDDFMQYSICSFTEICNTANVLGTQILVNDVVVWMQISPYLHQWVPGHKSTIFLSPGDVVRVTVTNIYVSGTFTYYWCMDFWRAPRE